MYRKLSMLFVLAAIILPASLSDAVEKKDEPKKEEAKKGFPDKVKWETANFEKALETEFGLRVKSWTMVKGTTHLDGEKKTSLPPSLRLLLEFTKDVDPQAMKASGLKENEFLKGQFDGPFVEMYFFDDENVRIKTYKLLGFLDGEITGKKDEAFRVYFVNVNENSFEKTFKVEMHLRMPKVAKKPDIEKNGN